MGPGGSADSFHSCLSMCHGWGPQRGLKTQAGSNQRHIHYHKSKHRERFKSGKLDSHEEQGQKKEEKVECSDD